MATNVNSTDTPNARSEGKNQRSLSCLWLHTINTDTKNHMLQQRWGCACGEWEMTKQYQTRVTQHMTNNTREIPKSGEYDALELEGGK